MGGTGAHFAQSRTGRANSTQAALGALCAQGCDSRPLARDRSRASWPVRVARAADSCGKTALWLRGRVVTGPAGLQLRAGGARARRGERAKPLRGRRARAAATQPVAVRSRPARPSCGASNSDSSSHSAERSSPSIEGACSSACGSSRPLPPGAAGWSASARELDSTPRLQVGAALAAFNRTKAASSPANDSVQAHAASRRRAAARLVEWQRPVGLIGAAEPVRAPHARSANSSSLLQERSCARAVRKRGSQHHFQRRASKPGRTPLRRRAARTKHAAARAGPPMPARAARRRGA